MPKKQKEETETKTLKRFFFPDDLNGVSIHAATLEEAQEKLASMKAERTPKTDSPKE